MKIKAFFLSVLGLWSLNTALYAMEGDDVLYIPDDCISTNPKSEKKEEKLLPFITSLDDVDEDLKRAIKLSLQSLKEENRRKQEAEIKEEWVPYPFIKSDSQEMENRIKSASPPKITSFRDGESKANLSMQHLRLGLVPENERSPKRSSFSSERNRDNQFFKTHPK